MEPIPIYKGSVEYWVMFGMEVGVTLKLHSTTFICSSLMDRLGARLLSGELPFDTVVN